MNRVLDIDARIAHTLTQACVQCGGLWIAVLFTQGIPRALLILLSLLVLGHRVRDLWQEHLLDRAELALWLQLGGVLFMTYQSEGARKITSVGPGWVHVLGWTPPEMIGQPLELFLHPQDTQLGASVDSFISRWRRKAGRGDQWAWLRWRTAESPRHVGVIFANALDETTQFDHIRTLSAWAEITSDLMLVADATVPVTERKPRWVNPAWTRLLGWSDADLYNMRIVDLLPPDEMADIIEQRKIYEEQGGDGTRSVTSRVRCKQASNHETPMYKSFRWNSQTVGDRVYVTGQDISSELEHEHDMQKVIESLKGRNQDLERFASVAAHQLRAPPRTIAGLSTVLLEDYGHLLDLEGRQCLQDIRQETDQMGEIIDGLYRFSRVRTSEDLVLTPVDLDAVARSVRKSLDRKNCAQCPHSQLCPAQRPPECPLQRHVLHVQKMPVVLGDRTLLQEVLLNLIDNGFKFNESPKKIVRVTWVLRQDGRVAVTVTDNGLGIDEKYQSKLFTMFQRMHPSYTGTGVGLALAAAIIQKLGGTIQVESRPGEGSAFTFDLQMVEMPGSKTLP